MRCLIGGFFGQVLEAVAQGTPSIVYDVDGLRDAVKPFATGLVTKTTSVSLSNNSVMFLKNEKMKKDLSEGALKHSYGFDWDVEVKKVEKWLGEVGG